jgi:hypothetical protein
METQVKTKIKGRIADAIKKYLVGKEVKTTHILDDIFPVERRVRSIIGGLETSLGTTLWEPIAKELALSNGFTVLNEKEFASPASMPKDVSAIISKWIQKRNKPGANLTLDGYIDELREHSLAAGYSDLEKGTLVSGEGIDVLLEKNGVEYAFDIKTVQINAKNGKSFSNTLMLWYASKIIYDPEADFKAAIAFPFNPYKKDWWEQNGSRAYPLVKKVDAYVANEFWDLLSGNTNTFESISDLFKELGEENFGDQFKDIFYPPIK